MKKSKFLVSESSKMVWPAGLRAWYVESMYRPSCGLILVLGYKIYNKIGFYQDRIRGRIRRIRRRIRQSDLGFDEADLGFDEADLGFGEADLGFDLGKIQFYYKFCILEPISSHKMDGTSIPHTKHEVRQA